MTLKRLVIIVLAMAAIASAVGLARSEAGRAMAARIAGAFAGADAVPARDAVHDHGASPSTTARGDVVIDSRRQQLIGVRLATVSRTAAAPSLRATGTVRYDETRLADVNVKLDGWVRELFVDYVGKPVRRGQPLLALYSPDLLATQNEYLLALTVRDRLVRASADVQDHTHELVAAARQRLLLWDIPPEDVARLEDTRAADGVVVFKSPAAGVVTEKTVLNGMRVMPGQMLYKVADLSTVWVEADVYERDIRSVHVGSPAMVMLDAYPGEHFSGRTVFVYPSVEEQTRTIKVRFAFPNRAGRLKPGMYATVELAGAAIPALTVPGDAVLDSGTEQVVFVSMGEGRFEPRQVKAGRHLAEGAIEILSGVKEGDVVAASAAFFLDSESQMRGALQGYAAPAGSAPAASTSAPAIDIVFRTQPDPAKVGENVFEAVVKDGTGKPVTGAEVSVQFYMPAMPAMNMPAMQNTVTLLAAADGVYRGSGEIRSGGRWDTTVTVTKNGQRLGSKQLTVVAR